MSFATSEEVRRRAACAVTNFSLSEGFSFLHVRRTDYLDNYILLPPYGSRPCTSPAYIRRTVPLFANETLVVATDEPRGSEYYRDLRQALTQPGVRIIYEEEIIRSSTDQYMAFLTLDEVAKRARRMVCTHQDDSAPRLG